MYLSPKCLSLLSFLRQWFCCCWIIVYCCSQCLWGFRVWFLFWYLVLCVHLVLQSSWLGRESWLLCFNCLPDVLWLSVFSDSSSRCLGLDCGVWLWYLLIILIFFFVYLLFSESDQGLKIYAADTNQCSNVAFHYDVGVGAGLEVIKFEFYLRLKIKGNDWLIADTCPQAANHCTHVLLFWV